MNSRVDAFQEVLSLSSDLTLSEDQRRQVAVHLAFAGAGIPMDLPAVLTVQEELAELIRDRSSATPDQAVDLALEITARYYVGYPQPRS